MGVRADPGSFRWCQALSRSRSFATTLYSCIITILFLTSTTSANNPLPGQQDAIHITAILGESVVFNCHVEFPSDHPVPFVLQREKKVSETVPPTNQTKLEGEKATFTCEAKAMPGNVTVRWFREGAPVREVASLETRVTIRKDGSLIINPVSADDSGQYLCEVSNGIGDPQSASAYLNVEYPAKVTFTPTVQYLPFRLAGVVQCYIKANPNLQYVTWTKDKRLLEPYQTKDIVIMNNGSLLFTRVNQNHQGRYTCTPYNAQGTQGSSGPMEVLVRKPPVFNVEPDPLYQRKVGESVEMHCDAQEAEGTQRPNIQWQRRDGLPLQRNRVKALGGNITIENLRRSDFGYYQCVASNEVATIVSATQLVIEGTQPHAPYNVSGTATEFSVTMSWMPGYSGGPDYKQEYTLWYREAGISDWSTIPVTPSGSTQVTINRLSPGTTYEFQVVGKNALGDGMMSKVVTIRTLDAAKSKPNAKTSTSTTSPNDHSFKEMPDDAGVGRKIDDMKPSNETMKKTTTVDTLLDLLRNMCPPNIIQACLEQTSTELTPPKNNTNSTDIYSYKINTHFVSGTNIMGIVVISTVIGIALSILQSDATYLISVIEEFYRLVMKVTSWAINLSPIGIFFLVVAQILKMEDLEDVAEKLGYYFLTVAGGCLIQGLVILPLIYFVFTRMNPYRFIEGLFQALLTAFGTSSSSATMPITLRCIIEHNNVDENVAKFMLPIGSAINMDGTALYEAVAAIFIAQYRNIELSFGKLVAISITATAASIGAAGIPSAGLVTMIMVLDTVGLPAEDVSLILAVDWLLDRIRTTVNVMGDAFGAGIINYWCRDDILAFNKQRNNISAHSTNSSAHSTNSSAHSVNSNEPCVAIPPKSFSKNHSKISQQHTGQSIISLTPDTTNSSKHSVIDPMKTFSNNKLSSEHSVTDPTKTFSNNKSSHSLHRFAQSNISVRQGTFNKSNRSNKSNISRHRLGQSNISIRPDTSNASSISLQRADQSHISIIPDTTIESSHSRQRDDQSNTSNTKNS